MSFLLRVIFIILFFLPPSLGAMQLSGDRTVEADGISGSKEDAIVQAKRNSVKKVIATILNSQIEKETFELNKDKIINQKLRAVHSYTPLDEVKKGEQWYVKIRAEVSLDTIISDLMAFQILLTSMDKPRTMILLEEQSGHFAQNTLSDYLKGKGFELVVPDQNGANKDEIAHLINKTFTGLPEAAANFGVDNGAEYVIVGSVNKSPLKNDFLKESGMKSRQASLAVKVINCSSGKIVASKSATGEAVHVSGDIARSRAAAKAATNLIDNNLLENIVASFQDTINNGESYDVCIFGVKDSGIKEKASKLLADTEGVVSVTRRSFGEGKLELSILFKGSVDTFCDRVASKPIADTILMVTNVAGNRIVLNLQ